MSNWAIVAMVVRHRRTFEMKIVNNYEIVAVMIVSSSLQLLSSELAFVVVVKAVNNSTMFAASAMDVNMSLVVEETAANN